jgi:hypothetical protein
MAAIPYQINGVNVTFHNKVNNDIDVRLLQAIQEVIRPMFPYKYTISSIKVSSLFDSHPDPSSRHNQKKAIDISEINGKRVDKYGSDPEITELVKQIQKEFEKIHGRRENFGPFQKLKLGVPHPVPGHDNHIHLSVN